MDSRPLIKNTKKIGILLDSETFEYCLKQENRVANAILNYNGSENLRFIRTPMDTDVQELKEIAEYKLTINENGSSENNQKINDIIIPDIKESHSFRYRIEDIHKTAEHFNDNQISSLDTFEKTLQVFVQAILYRSETYGRKNHTSNIFITEDYFLLQKRYWFESHFPGVPINIVTLNESSYILDLFLKNNKKYHAHRNHLLNKGGWYWLSMRSKLPHYNVDHEMLGALVNRFEYALMAFDEIGKEYYSGVNNDTMENTLYHFNYLITLTTGIFDNLALTTNDLLKIYFPEKIRISLSNKSGDKFLKCVRDNNPVIRNHINSYVDLINLVYIFRELVVHRDGLERTGYHYKNYDGSELNFNLIKISKNTSELIDRCGDKQNKFDMYSKWGQIKSDSEYYLIPYHFSKELIIELTKFVDEYLRLLGYDSFIEKQEIDKKFIGTLKIFKQFHLGL